MLSSWRPAICLHAVSVSNRPEPRLPHHVVRVRGGRANASSDHPQGGADQLVDGALQGPLRRRLARRGRDRAERRGWFDRAGNFASSNVRIVERFTFAGPDRLIYEAQIEDPTVFTRPWKMRMPLYRRAESDSQLLEFKCVEFAEDLIYGHLRRQPSK